MYVKFDKDTIKLINRVSKKVAKRLDVGLVDCVLVTGPNADYDADVTIKASICFGSGEDDTWANLDYEIDPDTKMVDILKNFLNNDDVEWLKQGDEI